MKTLAAFLLLTACAFADKPSPKIDGPTERHAGALTFLDAGASAGADQFGWNVDTSGVQVPADGTPDVSETVKQLRAMGFGVTEPEDESEPLWAVSDDGRRLWLSSYPGTYSVVLGVANADGVVLMPWKVVVTGGPVPPPVPPGPTPPPVPPGPNPPPIPPAPVTDLSAKVAAAVKAYPGDKEEFKAVAAVYEAVSKMCDSGLLATPDAVVSMTKTLSNAALPTHRDDWQKVVSTVIGPHLNALSQAGELETAAAHAKPWLEISNGIKAGIN